jgi:hypothetical protein
MPQPLSLASGGGGTLLVRHQTRTLLHACPGDVVLEVEQVLHVPSQQSRPDMEVGALVVGHGLKALLPYGILLIPNWEKRDRQCYSGSEAVLALQGESDVRHHLNASVGLTANDGPRPHLLGVEGNRHADPAHVLAVGHGQPATVDRSVPIVAKMDECVVWHSRNPRQC